VSFYEIPASLAGEIDELESLIQRHLTGDIDANVLKARRVPFGSYEQRKQNTYMVRIRTAAGVLSPRQLRAIAEISRQYGNDSIHITTRQEFQIHDVALDNITTIMRQLLAAGLATRGGGGNTVRNIMASPDSGVAKDEVFDVTPHALALTSRLISEPDSWVLPRKFKIAFSNSPADTAYATFNDLGFIATVKNGVKGFKVYMAGGLGAKSQAGHLVHDFIPAAEVYVVAEALKRVFDQHGNRKNKHAARLRFLWNQLGEARFLQLYRAEFETVRKNAAPFIVPEVGNEVLDPGLPVTGDDSAEFRLWKQRYATGQKQSGLYSVLVPFHLGNLRNRDAIAVAEFLAPFGDNVLRASLGQNLLLRNIAESYLAHVYALVKKIAPLATGPRLLAQAVSCTGADTCQLGICLAKGALTAISKKLAKSGLDLDQVPDFRLNLSGCPNTCGQHSLADLGFYGQVARRDQEMYPAYAVVAGAVVGDGKSRLAQNLDRVSARDLPDFVVDVLRHYLSRKDRYGSFAAYIEGQGGQDLRDACNRYRDVPSFEENKNYYYDWGAREVFSLVGRGVGECSAGLFDLIDVDLKLIKSWQQEIAAGLEPEKFDDALYAIALSAARMLLVTRGIEARSDAQVFDSFSTHFITAGLVEARFLPVIDAARRRDNRALSALREELYALAEAVEKLYNSMDNSLRFPSEVSAPPLQAKQPQVQRDYRTVACPMNFVKVKLDLARMQQGEVLRVLLGDGAPIENVPRSVVAEGHRILEQTRAGDHWSVVIEKA
jgi:sulfite reductase (ferredoxin)